MTIVVTGASGFIGSRLVARLADSGEDVVAVVRPGRGAEPAGARTVELPLEAIGSLPSILSAAETIVHLGWVGTRPEARNDPAAQLQNLAIGLDLVEAAATMGVARLVLSGSMSEFALHDGPVTGHEVSAPVDLYSAAKASARELMEVRAAQLGVGLIRTHITSVYGPGRTDSNLITAAIQALLAREVPRFTGLEQVWDYLYIDDLVTALALLAARGRPGTAYPIGSGVRRSLAEHVFELRDAIDPSLPLAIGVLPYKSARLDSSLPDISALVADTGFAPVVPFGEGIRRTIDAFRAEADRSGRRPQSPQSTAG